MELNKKLENIEPSANGSCVVSGEFPAVFLSIVRQSEPGSTFHRIHQLVNFAAKNIMTSQNKIIYNFIFILKFVCNEVFEIRLLLLWLTSNVFKNLIFKLTPELLCKFSFYPTELQSVLRKRICKLTHYGEQLVLQAPNDPIWGGRQ